MNILVTGGSGFVGHAVVRALQSCGHTVTVMNRGNRHVANTRQLVADRNDPAAVHAALEGAGFDAVVDTNCYTGTQADILVAALRNRVPLAVLISSAAVYGDAAPTPPVETDPVGGGSAWGTYGADKCAAEDVYENAGFKGCVAFRPPYICGPNNDLDRETWLLRRIIADRPILVPGEGRARYQFLHEDDFGTAICSWLDRSEEGFRAYNLADPQQVTAADLPGMMAKAAGRDCTVICVGSAGGDVKERDWYPFRDVDCIVDPAAFSLAFNWAPAASLQTRFKEIFEELSASGKIPPDDWKPLEEQLFSTLMNNRG